MATLRKGGYRHLIYFIDGTWLWAGSGNTLDVYSNVYRMNTLLNADATDGHAQIVHYSRGLGAIGGIRRYIDGGFANGIDVLIADLYVNICSNYQPNDRIYIFGFSRGAVVARALTGLLAKGILEDKYINSFADIWADYLGEQEVLEPGLRDDGPRAKQKIADYKSLCSDAHPTIEFVGVYETVSGGHGWAAAAQRLRLQRGRLQANVKNAVQILAMDETRSFFRPIMWTGVEESAVSWMEQIWMPGVHSDVGGAYAERTLGNIALITMIDRVLAKTRLSFDLAACRKLNCKLDPADPVRIHYEYANKYWRLCCPWPVTRRVNRDVDQSFHPIANYLQNNVVRYKSTNDRSRYELPSDFAQLKKEAPEFLTDHFESILPD
ncbi:MULTISPECIES: phospholipase effector Tle1 domain-containing protein [Bradyrhizobium]|uniref:phospholipase effector Tle1 domain-containing protein n=1 Tax=Bradyrhizobium TaxID=374 RepID=UPI0005770899|nr:DUF2235 domain-containing protein [Bradyrhizobium sp. CCBAU 15544]